MREPKGAGLWRRLVRRPVVEGYRKMVGHRGIAGTGHSADESTVAPQDGDCAGRVGSCAAGVRAEPENAVAAQFS
jgi:hypothetical protein